MKVAVEAYVLLFILILTSALCISFVASNLAVMEARDDFYSYASEIQESNFADSVIEACTNAAITKGYSLTISPLVDGDNVSANLELGFEYKILPLGISQNKIIRAYIN